MKLSIIIPVYNAEKFLPECLDSLASQTMDDYEVILINDGSKDSSQNIIEDYMLKYPGLFVSKTVENGGQGRARNIGIDLAKGEYIGFVDSDDWVNSTMFRKLYDKAVETNADIVMCDFMQCFDSGEKRCTRAVNDGNYLSAAGAVWNMLFRRSHIGDVRFPQGVWYEDFSFSAKLIMGTDKIVEINEALYYYRCGQTSTMNNNNARKNLDIIAVMDDVKHFMLENDLKGIDYLILNHMLIESVNRLELQTNREKKAVIAKVRSYIKENIPHLLKCEAFRAEKRNRRIIMFLNYHGMEKLSRLILNAKKKLSR